MWLDIFFVCLGLVFLIGVMAAVLNPPEFWIKRAFNRKNRGETNRKPR